MIFFLFRIKYNIFEKIFHIYTKTYIEKSKFNTKITLFLGSGPYMVRSFKTRTQPNIK